MTTLFPARVSQDAGLVPWDAEPIHQFHLLLTRLRDEERRRSGDRLDLETHARLRAWTARLRAHGLVVDYDPTTEQGFHLVPARPGIDTDLIRVPTAYARAA
ncbi:hypothetical protein R8Z50_31165 [Longispora sp. K20-0274]|uniref:hypothetical protein n=1 Tax=Longispora sp. K20-0274 TaxID=3088255 RepID=UPI00399BD28D